MVGGWGRYGGGLLVCAVTMTTRPDLVACVVPSDVATGAGNPGQKADPAGSWSSCTIESFGCADFLSYLTRVGLILPVNSPLSTEVQGAH